MTNAGKLYPHLKGTDRVRVECGRCCGTGLYSGPTNATWVRRGEGERPWCFYCGGDAFRMVLVSSLRATARRNEKRAAELAAEAERFRSALGQWRNDGFEEAVTRADHWCEILRHGDPRRTSLVRAVDAIRSPLTATFDGLEAVLAMLGEIEAHEANKPELVEGRRAVTGTVAGFKVVDSQWGSVTKVIIEEPTGTRVYGTLPAALSYVERGARVTFTATVERSSDDRSFGFYTRPVNATALDH